MTTKQINKARYFDGIPQVIGNRMYVRDGRYTDVLGYRYEVKPSDYYVSGKGLADDDLWNGK